MMFFSENLSNALSSRAEESSQLTVTIKKENKRYSLLIIEGVCSGEHF